MRPVIHLVSDLHLEFQPDGGQSLVSKLPEADVLIVAGDLSNTPTLFGALKMLSAKYPHVVFVPGNHDWYSGSSASMAAVADRVRDELPNVHWDFEGWW